MPKLIVTSRYLKSGGQKNLANYVKYIATRQGSVAVKQNSGTAPATDAQRKLIDSLLKDFPDSKEMLEYIDYQQSPTQKSASAFIREALERNADRLANRENYVNYLANRPGAVKFGSHGLFSSEDKPIDLEAVAKEIADHSGNVWTHVVSLRRDDAQRMGYDTLDTWRNLVKRQIPNIAKAQKIDLANLRWYAAFHDKQTNPHVHIVVYSTDEHEGFLTKQGIEKIRSGFVNDIYADELHHLYAQQTDLRNLLKQQSADLMHRLAAEIQSGTSDAELCDLILRLHSQLANTKGKKVYGYLKPQIKRTVDRIFERLAEHEAIQKMYALWCDMEQQKHDVYSSAKVDFPPLSENPQFHSVRNMIVRTCAEMDVPVLEEQAVVDGHPPPEDVLEVVDADAEYWGEPVEEQLSEELNVPNFWENYVSPEETLQHSQDEQRAALNSIILALCTSLARCIEDDYYRSHQKLHSRVDRKLQRMIQQKKLAQGIKEEQTQTPT